MFSTADCMRMVKMSKSEKRTRKRVSFERGVALLAVDGTWSATARLLDISDTGAKLNVFGLTSPRMKAEEFFLLITTDGRVRKRAKMVWETKKAIGVQFIASMPSVD